MTKFSGNVLNGPRNISDFGSDLDHLDPGFFKGSYSQIILGCILMIVQELSSLGGGLRCPSVLVLTWVKSDVKFTNGGTLFKNNTNSPNLCQVGTWETIGPMWSWKSQMNKEFSIYKKKRKKE